MANLSAALTGPRQLYSKEHGAKPSDWKRGTLAEPAIPGRGGDDAPGWRGFQCFASRLAIAQEWIIGLRLRWATRARQPNSRCGCRRSDWT